MRHHLFLIATAAVLVLAACGKKETPPAQAEPAPAAEAAPAAEPAPAEPTAPAAAAEPASGCNYAIANQKVTGPCPAGTEDKGQCELTQEGDTFTFLFKTGRTCNPASMCTFTGTIAGDKYSGGNEAVVDPEGGKVTNTMEITVGADGAGTGSGTSTYAHPGGMTCNWSYDISFTQ